MKNNIVNDRNRFYMWRYGKRYTQAKNYIYIFALFVFLVSTILSKTMWMYSFGETFEFSLKVMRYVSYIACMLKILSDNYYFSDFWRIVTIIILILIITYFSASMLLFTYGLIFVSSYRVEKKTIIKCAVYIQACLLFVIIFASQIGLNLDYIFDAGDRNRHGLGFTWTTTPAILFFFIILEYMYLREKRMRIIEYIVILILSNILFRLTNTRLTFYLSVMSVVFFWFLGNVKITKGLMKKLRFVWIMMPLIVAFFSYYIHCSYVTGSWIWEKLNDILSGRLKLGNTAIERYGIKFFGQEIEWIGYGYQAKEGLYNYVDCSYLQILIQYGLILLGICIVMYAYILLKAMEKDDFYLCGCVLIILFYSVTEPFLLNLMFNPFPLLAVSYLGERKIERK